VLFTFPSRYWFTIGRQRVFSLGGWSPRIPTGFLVSRGTWELEKREPHTFRLQDYHLLWCDFPDTSARCTVFDSPTCHARQSSRAPQPRRYNARTLERTRRFRLFPVRSPLLGKSSFLSLPGANEMVQFAPLAPTGLFYSAGGNRA
jgi:hypothetical protein